MNIPVTMPDLNRSYRDFRVDGEAILFALAAIKGCGAAAADAIVSERAASGPFDSIFELCERIPSTQCSRSTIESLIKAGALDSLGGSRAQHLAVLDRALQSGAAAQADKRRGQMSLFGESKHDPQVGSVFAMLPDLPEIESRKMLAAEREVLGFYLSSHPLEQHRAAIARFVTHTTAQANHSKDRESVTMGGMISAIKFSNTRPREPNSPIKYAMFDLEDLDGSIRCIQWPGEFAEQGTLIQTDAVVVIQGIIDRRGGDEANLIAKRVIPLNQTEQFLTAGIRLRLTQPEHSESTVRSVYEIVRGYPGAKCIELDFVLDNGLRVRSECGKQVELSEELLQRLQSLLGGGCVESILAGPSLTKAKPSRAKPFVVV